MPYATCQYFGRAGVCGKRCFAGRIDGDRCGVHRTRKSLNPCAKGCGRGTQSKTGFCAGCGWAQNDGCKKLRQQAKRKEAHRAEVIAFIRENPEIVAAAAAADGPPPLEEEPPTNRETDDLVIEPDATKALLSD